MSKKLFTVLSVCVIASLMLVACGGTGAGGGGTTAGGTVKVVSDLPMTGSSLGQTQTIVNAIKMAFEEKNYKACNGTWTIQYEAKDDASAALGKWDPDVATANAKAYAADKNVVAVIGTYNSGAAKLEIPIVNPENLVMISPANTYPGLTREVAGVTEAGEPGKYYPNGKRNYSRVVAADHIQGAANVFWARDLGAKSIYILDDQETYGKGIADVVHVEATKIGLNVLGQEGIDTKAADYKALATKVIGLSPDLVYLGMITQNGAGQVVKDLRGAGYTGIIMGPDGIQEKALIEAAGDAAEGVYGSFAGVTPDVMQGDAATWKTAYKAKYNADPEVYAVYGYVSVQVLLAAFESICTAGGKLSDRETVRAAVLATKNLSTVLGPMTFDENGDATTATMTGSRVVNGAWTFQTFLPTK
jgi:branched-chain amino acid transport system substrate-binding protein